MLHAAIFARDFDFDFDFIRPDFQKTGFDFGIINFINPANLIFKKRGLTLTLVLTLIFLSCESNNSFWGFSKSPL